MYFRLPTYEDRLQCYAEIRGEGNIEAALCFCLCHYFSRLLDLFAMSFSMQVGITFEQQILLRDTEMELHGPGYRKLHEEILRCLEMDRFNPPGVGRLPLNCMLSLGTRILFGLLQSSGELKALDIIGMAKTLIALLWKGRTFVFVNPIGDLGWVHCFCCRLWYFLGKKICTRRREKVNFSSTIRLGVFEEDGGRVCAI